MRDLAYCFFLSYWTVLAAELIGDKSIYTVTSLAMRFQPAWVYCGIAAAFMGKTLVAVGCGGLIARLPASWTAALSAATFFATASCVWLLRPSPERPGADASPARGRAVMASFSAIFFSEWADFGQVSTAALAAKYGALGTVWLGGSLALCTKGALALTLGLSLRRRVPAQLARALAATFCLLLGVVSLCDLLWR